MSRSHENDFREWSCHVPFDTALEVVHEDLKRTYIFQSDTPGSIDGSFTAFKPFLVSQVAIQMDGPARCCTKEEGKTIGMFFNLSGRCRFDTSGKEQTINPGEQYIYFSAGHHHHTHLFPDNGKIEYLEIMFPVSFYMNLFSAYSVKQNEFTDKMLRSGYSFIHLGIMPMTLPMKWIINTLKQCTRTGVLKRLFFEGKVLELLMLQIEQSELISENHIAMPKQSDIDSLHYARKILSDTLHHPPTIRELSRKVGLNEFTLKKGFRDMFNTTIHGYVNELKMQQAKQMIIAGDRSIQEIALLSGYKNPQHFTVAFKKYFGQLPSKLKSQVEKSSVTGS